MLRLDMILWESLVLLAFVSVLGLVLGRAYLKYQGSRVITCPENCQAAGVAVDGGHVLLTALKHSPELRLKTCSRWPEHRDCGQECLRQIEAAPEDCLVRHIVSQWYHDKRCGLCGKHIGEIQWTGHQPALLDAQSRTVDWRDVRAEELPAVLASHQAVCWNCHVFSRMVHEHGDLVLDRSRHV